MSRLTKLLPSDSRNLLTDAQRLYVDEARLQADLIQSRALHEIEMSEVALTGRTSLKLSPGDGQSYIVYRRAIIESVRLVLNAEARAFRGAGLFSRKFREVLTEESLESATNSFELSQIERDLLYRELNLYRPEFDLPEWLLVPREIADATLSPLCRISRDGLARLEQSRREAENAVDGFEYAASAQLSGKPEPPDFQRRIVGFGRDCVSSYVRRFGLAVFEEWDAVLKAEAPPWGLFPTLKTAVVQMAVDYTRIAHSLSRVSDWKALYLPAKDYIAQLSDQVEQRTAQVGFRNGPLN